MTEAVLRASLEGLLVEAEAIANRVDAELYASTAPFEADVNEWRTSLAALLDEVDSTWGAAGWTLRAALEGVGVRLIDMRASVVGDEEVIVVETDRESSLMELALGWYGDLERWLELAALNPLLPAPHAIPAGTEVARRVR